jgi:hypothetical protein
VVPFWGEVGGRCEGMEKGGDVRPKTPPPTMRMDLGGGVVEAIAIALQLSSKAVVIFYK